LASTFVQPGAGQWADFDYSRSGNPTRAALEKVCGDLEGGVPALAYASGMAATHGATMLLKPGDHVLAGSDLYGGTYRLLHQVCSRLQISTSHVDATDLAAVERAWTPQTRLLWVESIGNPLLSVPSLRDLAELAHRHGAWLGVDNTLASPALLRPLDHGADLVMHSATKYLGGHSDCLGGILVARDPELRQQLYFLQNATGAVADPLSSFLICRGIKTLDLRIRAQSTSAMELARRLSRHPAVEKVYYPGLETHPTHDIAKRQLGNCFGALLSFELRGDGAAAAAVCNRTQLFQVAVSLGAVESLISQPATMSHSSYAAEARRAAGIVDSLIRCSVGLEDVDDLWNDLCTAIECKAP
jgi:cystathionine beta-lyase/cystathionine gamma-synthase